MDASWIHIKYLINADGTVSIPNSTPNSLQNVQGTFITGERVYVSSRNESGDQTTAIGSDNNKSYREVIRGATRIEPILYNQSGSQPPQWYNTIELYDAFKPNVGDYKFTANMYTNLSLDGNYYPPSYTWSPPLTPAYTVPQGASDDDIILQVTASIGILRINTGGDITQGGMYVRLINQNNNNTLAQQFYNNFTTDVGQQTLYIHYEIPLSSLNSLIGSNLVIQYFRYPDLYPLNPPDYRINGATLLINQYPSPGSQPVTIIPPNIWQHAYPNIMGYQTCSMFTTQSFMVNAYDTNLINPTWYMKDIENSGFNPILTEWGVKRGDVFRFEGDQEKAYIVDSTERIDIPGFPPTPILIINFAPDVDLTGININHYSLTRYVDDASQIIVKGFRPNNSSSPYIIKPEFVVPELDKDIDAFIVDLTQKGLL
jgi:hypothetical protein